MFLAHVGGLAVAAGEGPWVWAFDPLQLLVIARAGFAYGRRALTLRRRGRPVRRTGG